MFQQVISSTDENAFQKVITSIGKNDLLLTNIPAYESFQAETPYDLTLEDLKQLAYAMLANTHACSISYELLNNFVKPEVLAKKTTERQKKLQKSKNSSHLDMYCYPAKRSAPTDPEQDIKRQDLAKIHEEKILGNYQPEAQPYIDIIKTITEQNQSNKTKDYFASKAQKSHLSECLKNNFENFCLTPLAYSAEIGKEIFSKTLGLSPLLTKAMTIMPPWTRVSLPTITVNPKRAEWGENTVGIGWISYSVNPLSLSLIPINYVARNLGKVVGAVGGLVISTLLSPVALIKSVIDNQVQKYQNRSAATNIAQGVEEENTKIIQKLPGLIDLTNTSDVLIIYRNTISQLPDKAEVIFNALVERLELLVSTSKVAYYDLGLLYLEVEDRDMAYACFKQVPGTVLDDQLQAPDFAKTMFEIANTAFDKKDYAEAKQFFEYASAAASLQGDKKMEADCHTLLAPVTAGLNQTSYSLGQKRADIVQAKDITDPFLDGKRSSSANDPASRFLDNSPKQKGFFNKMSSFFQFSGSEAPLTNDIRFTR